MTPLDQATPEYKIEVITRKAIEVRYLWARCGVRYWEDATVNGEPDEDGSRIPLRRDEDWAPVIDLHTGIIRDWPEGTTASIHYKVCDDGEYLLLDESLHEVTRIEGYVPTMMCPEGDGYGDYVIMNVDGEGRIAKWKVSLEEFEA